MTPGDFRNLALRVPKAIESAHMGHPDFRVGGKIFASLWSDGETGMVKLTSEQQATFVDSDPDAFRPAQGAWGRSGCTLVTLPAATKTRVKQALVLAWRSTAPKKLAKEFEGKKL